MLQTFLITIPVQASHLCRIHSARLLKPTRVPAPVAAAGFAVPLGHAFPFFAVSENSAAGFDLLRLFTSRNAVNGRHDISRTALRTQAARFTCCRASRGRLFHCRSTYPESLRSARQSSVRRKPPLPFRLGPPFRVASQSPGNCVRFAARMLVLDATTRYMANRETGIFINGFVGLFAELSERLLDQLDGGRGIENFLLIQVDIFDAVLAAVGGGNLLFRDIDP
jgi:hypothetical protein